ncbi:MAG: hypothetical protein FWC26_02490 [Fibromonadales bacterium]|nr:hypothetical protein [Fibromonadales bacterium]
MAVQDHAYVKPVQESKKNDIPSIPQRVSNAMPWNDPEFLKHMAERVRYGREDVVCDYIPNTHNGFEEILMEAKTLDDAYSHPIFWLPNAISKEIIKRKLINDGFERQSYENCEGLRSWP